MKASSSSVIDPTLTRLEKVALSGLINLSDGHAHHSPTDVQASIMLECASDLTKPKLRSQSEIEATFLANYFLLGLGAATAQARSWPRSHICYSASSAMEIVANVLRLSDRRRTLVLQPTFDNIPSILRRHGAELVGRSDSELLAHLDDPECGNYDAVVLVAPNNPTGQTFSNSDLVRIVDYCIRAKAILVLDFAFRFFDPSMVWDQYELLDGSGVSYLAIEDLGKIWPTRDLKVGILTSSADLYAETDRVHDDFLLNVSPFTLELLSRFCTAREPALVLADIQALPLHNRRTLVASLAPFGLVDRTSMATLSVAWLQLPANYPDSFEFCALAERHGVHVLPGPLFYFERRALGTHLVRLALMRDPPIVDEGCRRLQSLCRQLMTC